MRPYNDFGRGNPAPTISAGEATSPLPTAADFWDNLIVVAFPLKPRRIYFILVESIVKISPRYKITVSFESRLVKG